MGLFSKMKRRLKRSGAKADTSFVRNVPKYRLIEVSPGVYDYAAESIRINVPLDKILKANTKGNDLVLVDREPSWTHTKSAHNSTNTHTSKGGLG